ncbi:glycosyltransferase family 4 protein [Klebsiella electrica]|uniref:glycosyltransferase family 4 protein n=1 Tax=Klebsiella electrica TaxID=1259973 RepID=UPI002554B378|nr:glycosyltransferase family 4 protein [Klebsiella electrica]WIO41748.1 glycosyltransferase family 4 protein [Klebsiella electrica]
MEKILCIHQSAELYGSDRSFFSAIEGLNKEKDVNVILPFHGDLATLIENSGMTVSYYDKGILRKKEIKKIVSFAINSLKGIAFYINSFRKYDIVYINTVVMFSAILASSLFRFSKRKKIYCHVREIPSGKQLAIFRFLFLLAGIKLIYNSSATKHAFNLPGDVVYNGVPDILLRENKISKSSGNIINILLIGRINTWKGHQLLISALTNLKLTLGSSFNYKIRIVGSVFEGYEYLETELADKIKDGKLTEDITFFNFTKNPIEHYLWADYIIVPSTKPEPFGRVAVEAFSAGKPVIAADHGGLSEIVTDGCDGFLFEPNNVESLQSILIKIREQNDKEYLILSENSRRKYENCFSEEKYQNEIKKIILGGV